jgi:hypothetical protein
MYGYVCIYTGEAGISQALEAKQRANLEGLSMRKGLGVSV